MPPPINSLDILEEFSVQAWFEYQRKMYQALEAEILYGVNWRDALKTFENPIQYEEVNDDIKGL